MVFYFIKKIMDAMETDFSSEQDNYLRGGNSEFTRVAQYGSSDTASNITDVAGSGAKSETASLVNNPNIITSPADATSEGLFEEFDFSHIRATPERRRTLYGLSCCMFTLAAGIFLLVAPPLGLIFLALAFIDYTGLWEKLDRTWRRRILFIFLFVVILCAMLSFIYILFIIYILTLLIKSIIYS